MQKPLNAISKYFGLGLLCVAATMAQAQDGKMYPMENPEEPRAIVLGTGAVEDQDQPETWFRQWGDPMARNISQATLTPFLADPAKSNGATVIVAPGGGFMWLSMDNEGWQVAEALAAQGINAFVLKYRLQPTAGELEEFENQLNQRMSDAARMAEGDDEPPRDPRPRWDLSNQLTDVETAYALIKSRADEWNVDVNNIGMMGFSAGAGLTMHTTLNSEKVELAFIAPVYGGMNRVELPEKVPPMFSVIAVDDFLFTGDFGVIKSWYEADVPVEFHLYQNGGHGFGLGNPDRTSNKWFDAFIHWLDVNDFI